MLLLMSPNMTIYTWGSSMELLHDFPFRADTIFPIPPAVRSRSLTAQDNINPKTEYALAIDHPDSLRKTQTVGDGSRCFFQRVGFLDFGGKRVEKLRNKNSYRRQLGYNNSQHRQEINHKISQVVMGIVRAEEEEQNWNAEEEFLRWGILVPVIDLLPHVQVVVGARVELEGHATNVVKHEV